MIPPMFSIIIPVYNVEEYIHECIESVLLQDFHDYECILIDDGSTDNCPKICDEYARRDKRFHVIHQANKGLSGARNAGIGVAHGEYIVMLDGDDIFVSYYALRDLSDTISKTEAKIIYNANLTKFSTPQDYENIDMITSPVKEYRPMQLIKESGKNKSTLLAGAFYTINRALIIENNLFYKEKILHEDIHWVPRIFCCCDYVAVNHNLFYGYRINRQGSITNAKTETNKRLNSYIIILNDLLSLSKEQINDYKKSIYASFYKNVWWKIFATTAVSTFGDADSKTNKKEAINELKKTSHCLLHTTNLKYFFIFICVRIFSIKNALDLYLFFRGPRSR